MAEDVVAFLRISKQDGECRSKSAGFGEILHGTSIKNHVEAEGCFENARKHDVGFSVVVEH